MSKYAVMPMTDYEGICNAVRAKTGGTAKLKSSEVKQEIEGIQAGSDPVIEPLTVTENGTYSAPSGVDGYNPVTVNVAASGGDDGSFKAVIERTATEVTLPSDLTKIGDFAFYDNKNIILRSLPDGITSIGENAFYSCANIELETLPNNITSIGKSAFYDCDKITIQELPPELTEIGSSAFLSCDKLAISSIPSGVTSIGSYTFQGCQSILSMFFPSGIKKVGYAFASCTSLNTVTFAGTPDEINQYAFENCTKLITINVPWAEGEVAGAPWSATKATINYNYTGG